MANDDRAIVVGVQIYPALGHLGGAYNDAIDFAKWLKDEQGLEEGNITTIATPSEHIDAPPSLDQAAPTMTLVLQAGEKLHAQAQANFASRGDYHIGRRLYLYFAGHGYAVSGGQTAVMMANASALRIGPPYHWLGEYTADWFYRSGYFDQVLLFMDCCREDLLVKQLNMPWDDPAPHTKNVQRFYAYAVKTLLRTREITLGDNSKRGRFSNALMEGLRSDAYEPGSTGDVTTSALQQYLIRKIGDNGVLNESDFVVDYFSICSLPNNKEYPVTIHLPPGSGGQTVQLLNGHFGPVRDLHPAIDVWQGDLEKGNYRAQIQSTGWKVDFPVHGVGAVDVPYN